MSAEASLYIHVPFCAYGKCDYCDFYSVPLKKNDPRPAACIETLLLEGERLFDAFRPDAVPSVYIGGGTPSVLGSGISRLLKGVTEIIARYSSSLPVEISVEANPESADEAFLAAARGGGATRLSLGIQTFHGPSRKMIRREPGSAGFDDSLPRERLKLAAAYFPGAFSVDLMSGLPLQNEAALLADIDEVTGCRPAHISLYALTVEEGTPLASSVRAGRVPLPDKDEADRLWIAGRDALERSGYGQYEVSNFCLEGGESLHNIRYWCMQGWLGLGPAASGTIVKQTGALRYTVPPDLDAWLEAGGCWSGLVPLIEEIDTPTFIKEHILMGFRYTEGPDKGLFRGRFGLDLGDCIPETICSWRNRGLLRKDREALTKEGLLLLDQFLIDAFLELDGSEFPR